MITKSFLAELLGPGTTLTDACLAHRIPLPYVRKCLSAVALGKEEDPLYNEGAEIAEAYAAGRILLSKQMYMEGQFDRVVTRKDDDFASYFTSDSQNLHNLMEILK